MLRTNLSINNVIAIETPNGGIMTQNNSMSKASAKAQRTTAFTKVKAIRPDGSSFETTKARLAKEGAKKRLHNFIDRF